jgi:hypothetical protein
LTLVDIEEKVYLVTVAISIALNLYLGFTHYANNEWSQLVTVCIKFGIYNSYTKSLSRYKRKSILFKTLYYSTPFILFILLLVVQGIIKSPEFSMQQEDATVVVIDKPRLSSVVRDLPPAFSNVTKFDDNAYVICYSTLDPPDTQNLRQEKEKQAILLCVANLIIWISSHVLLFIINRSVQCSPSYQEIQLKLFPNDERKKDFQLVKSEIANLLCNKDVEMSEMFMDELKEKGIEVEFDNTEWRNSFQFEKNF